jgi:hypothetical protein
MWLREKMMNSMMDKMSSEEKKGMMDSMMDRFFSTMSKEEKQDMMQSMMPKMMKNMMGGKDGKMMNRMMSGENDDEGEQKMPWDMCKKMMSRIEKSNDMAMFATPEILQLFEDWARQIEDEIYEFITKSESIDVEFIQKQFKLTKESVLFFLNRLAQKGKIKFDK